MALALSTSTLLGLYQAARLCLNFPEDVGFSGESVILGVLTTHTGGCRIQMCQSGEAL